VEAIDVVERERGRDDQDEDDQRGAHIATALTRS
jgi:hypothetical protein